MEKQYVYRKHLRQPFKYLLTLFLFFIIVYAACSFVFILTSRDIDTYLAFAIFAIVGAAISAILVLEFLVLYFVLFRRFKKISISLTEEGIIYNNMSGVAVVPYNEIKAISFPSVRYVGGWVKIIHAKGNIKLTVVLENIGDFLKNLKCRLDSMNFPYDEKKMYNFYKTAEFSDQSWERLYDYIKWILLFIAVNLVVTVLFVSFRIEAVPAFLLVLCSVILPAIAFIIAEAIIGRKLAKGASMENFHVPERDKGFEVSTYKWVFGVYIALYLIFNIYLLI